MKGEKKKGEEHKGQRVAVGNRNRKRRSVVGRKGREGGSIEEGEKEENVAGRILSHTKKKKANRKYKQCLT